MLKNIKKILFASTSGLNTDDADNIIPPMDYLGMENCRVSVSQTGKNVQIQNIPSPVKIDSNSGKDIYGTAVDDDKRRLFYFVHDDTDPYIKCWDIVMQAAYIVLKSSQTSMGFDWVRIYNEAKVVNGYLIFTYGSDEIFEVNIEAGIKLNNPLYVTDVEPYATPIQKEILTLIKESPAYPPVASKSANGDSYNYISNNAFQFNLRYEYKNNQYSNLSSFSNLIRANTKTETDTGVNNISVVVPLGNKINDYVQSVEICARYGNYGKTKIIKRYDKRNTQDAAAIIAHNAGTALQVQFTNIGDFVPVDDISANTESPLIPNGVKALTTAKGRLFLANFEAGIDPTFTPLTAISSTTGGEDGVIFKCNGAYKLGIAFFDEYKRKTGISQTQYITHISIPDNTYLQTTGFVQKITWMLSNVDNGIPVEARYYCIYITKDLVHDFFLQFISNIVSYAIKNPDGTYDYTSTTYSDSTTFAIAIDISSLAASGLGYVYNEGDVVRIYDSIDPVIVANVIGMDGNKLLVTPKDIGATGALYLGTIPSQSESLDEYLSLIITTTATSPSASISYQNQPGGALDFPNARLSTGWMLNITDGEEYLLRVEIDITHIGKLRAVLVFTHPTLDSIHISIADSYVDGRLQYVMYATVPEGYTKVFVCSYKVESGCSISDGTIKISVDKANSKFIEIYTPHKDEGNALYYQATPIYDIIDPHTASREYGTLSGDISGDTPLLQRIIYGNAYTVQAMSPNDITWKQWERPLGWVNVVDSIGKKRVEDDVLWTDTIVNDTKLNGLNWIQPLNRKNIGDSTGGINKLIVAGKQNEIGRLLLILTPSQPISAYLGETQLMAASQQSGSPLQSTEVIGSLNPLINANGTSHPESVIEYNGQIFWFDVLTSTINQYSTNGIIDVQRYKIDMFIQKYATVYKNIFATHPIGFQYICFAVDPLSERVVVLLPQISAQPDNLLPSYNGINPIYASSIKNRFDFYSNSNKAFLLHYDYTNNRWKETFEWQPQWMATVGSDYFTFHNGDLYQHNIQSGSFNTVYGTQYPQRVIFAINEMPSAVKDLMNIVLEGNGAIPNYTVAYTKYPFEQITDITHEEWYDYEGAKVASWLMDRLSPNVSGSAEQKMIDGDVLNSNVIYIMIEFQEYSNPLAISGINIGVEMSAGNDQIVSHEEHYSKRK